MNSCLGPELPVTITRHSMIPLGNGQAIIGGIFAPGPNGYNSKIYFLTCVNSNLTHSNLEVFVLNQTLSFPRRSFLAIPITDIISGCISGGKINTLIFWDSFPITTNKFLYPKIANCLSLLVMVTAMITQIICIVGLILMTAVDLFV